MNIGLEQHGFKFFDFTFGTDPNCLVSVSLSIDTLHQLFMHCTFNVSIHFYPHYYMSFFSTSILILVLVRHLVRIKSSLPDPTFGDRSVQLQYTYQILNMERESPAPPCIDRTLALGLE